MHACMCVRVYGRKHARIYMGMSALEVPMSVPAAGKARKAAWIFDSHALVTQIGTLRKSTQLCTRECLVTVQRNRG